MKKGLFRFSALLCALFIITAPAFADVAGVGGAGAGIGLGATALVAALGAGYEKLKKKNEGADDVAFEDSIKSLTDADKTLMRQVRKQLQSSVNDMLLTAADEASLKSAFADYEAELKDFVKNEKQELADNFNKILLSMKSQIDSAKFQKQNNEVKDMSIKGQILSQIASVNEKGELVFNEGYKAFKEGKSQKFNLELDLKVSANMMVSTNVTGNDVVRRESDNSITDLIRRIPIFKMYTNYSSTNAPRYTYVEKRNPDGTITMVAEGAAKPKIDFDLVSTEVKAKKVPGHIKVSTEILDDVDGIANEINTELRYQIESKIDTQLISGDGTGENLTGVTTVASAFTATALSVTTPNNFDCLKACATQVKLAEGQATHAFLNPTDCANMELAKGSDGHYIMPPFVTSDGKTIAGLKLVETTAIPAGSVLVGDMTKVFVKEYKTFAATMGWENDDFTKNFVTIVGEARLMVYVKTNHVTQFVYDTFSNIKTALA